TTRTAATPLDTLSLHNALPISKTKLGNGEVEGIVTSAFGDALATALEENPRTAKAILEKAVQAYRAWEAARKARDLVRRKGALSDRKSTRLNSSHLGISYAVFC